MEYKLCILAAGIGSRMQPLTFNSNKALLPVGGNAAISRIIEKHSKEIEIVIAIGYEKDKLIQYLECAHPDRKIKFVEVDKITGPGTGPGYSLLCCQKYLQSPFILTTVDTIFDEVCPKPDKNWMGVAEVNDSKSYCTIVLSEERGEIIDLVDKIECNNKEAFIGLAGIRDYKDFFISLLSDNSEREGEIQVSNGFRGLFELGLNPERFTWYDIGSLDGYKLANSSFSREDQIFDFSKTDECIYFCGGSVIKHFANKEIVSNRLIRSKLLSGLCPKIEIKNDYFYSYQMIPGKVVYDQFDSDVTLNLLNWLDSKLWARKNLKEEELDNFQAACRSFYYQKTLTRLDKYCRKFEINDLSSTINNENIPSTKHLINLIDFDWLCNGIPSNFHGDLQFDNILINEKNKFVLLDWRQDFSGITEYGDMYYDLAKLNGGMYVSYKNIKKGLFDIKKDSSQYLVSFEKDDFLVKSKKIFNQYIEINSLDIKKIEILTGLIFLNMSPMHHPPFSHYIYNMGRYQLNKWLNH
jgi:NDP-sugar pyrophosphorylase family protein